MEDKIISTRDINEVARINSNPEYKKENTVIFYHGGAEPDFSLEQLDVLRPSQKQQNANGSYAGFYMYNEADRDGAFYYSEQENFNKGTNTKGVVKLTLDSNLKTYEISGFNITRITQEQIRELQSQGYDLIAGKVMGKTEYVLLNKNKIKEMEFLSMDKRYNASENLRKNIDWNSLNLGSESNIDKFDGNIYLEEIRLLEKLEEIFYKFDLGKESIKYNEAVEIIKYLNREKNSYNLSDLYKNKIQSIISYYDVSKMQSLYQEYQTEMQQNYNLKQEELRKQQLVEEKQKQEEMKKQQLINQQYQSTLQQLVELRKQALQIFNNDIHNETLNRLLRSFLSVYNLRNLQNITNEQLDKLYDVYNQFDSVIEENKNIQTNTETKATTIQEFLQSEKSPIIKQQREQIIQLISDFKDYRSQPKINNELTKVEQRFEQLKQSSSGNLVSEQQKLIDWLTNAKSTMLSRIQEKQDEIKKEQEKLQTKSVETQPVKEQTNQSTNEYKQMISELVETRKIEQEQALANFNATRQQAQTELINKRMAEIYKTLGKGNVYQQIEDEMNYGGFSR